MNNGYQLVLEKAQAQTFRGLGGGAGGQDGRNTPGALGQKLLLFFQFIYF